MLEFFYKLVEPLKLRLLPLVCLSLLLYVLRLLLPVLGIISRIAPELFPFKLVNSRHHLIQEKSVMGHKNHRIGIYLHVVFKPLHSLNIQMVCRLIK